MLFHPVKKYVFISTPKTGTTSIEDHIMQIDPEAWLNRMPDAYGAPQRVRKHISAREARLVLGDRAADFTFVAFIRDPAETALSKYYYYRQGDPYNRWRKGTLRLFNRNKNWYKPSLAHKVLLARALPPIIWASIYPLKLNHHFLVDGHGKLLIDELGKYDCLQEDFTTIFAKFGYRKENLELPVRNATKYSKAPPQLEAMRRIVRRRCPEDMTLYSSVYPSKK